MINEIVLYQPNDLSTKLEVRVEDETIWLTQAQIILLFNSSKANISEHIKHIFQTHELKENATVRKFRTVRKEGNRTVTRNLTRYNLDMIIAIGYRVNSKRGTQFRIWANTILKDYLLKGYASNNRMNCIEDKGQQLSEKVESNYTKKLKDLEDIKRSILQKAFAGALTSPEGTKYEKEVHSASDNIITNQNPERVK